MDLTFGVILKKKSDQENLNSALANASKSLTQTLPVTPDINPSNEFSSYPSASLQSVIKHNEDLMARLSVNLRRVGHLEKIIEDVSMRFKIEKSNSDSLRDELLIHNEKNRLSESQLQKMTAELSRYQKSSDQLQTKSDSLMAELLDKSSEYESRLQQLKLEVDELADSKRYAEDELKPKLAQMEEKNGTLLKSVQDSRLKNEDLKEKLLNLSQQAQAEALKFQSLCKDLQTKIRDKDQLISQFQGLDEKIKFVTKEKTILENKNIDLEHEVKRIFSAKSSELENVQSELTLKNNEIQKLKIENYELKKSWADAHKRAKDFESQNSSLEEQSNSMKHMWQEKNRKQTELESQLKILENMRHELSNKLRNLDNEIKSKNLKINDLLSMIDMMKSKGQFEKDAILETAIRGVKNLYFQEEEKPSIDSTKTISF